MKQKEIEKHYNLYKSGLFDDILPFWTDHSIDKEFGGYIIGLDRSGKIIETDKPMWIQGRFAWLLSRIYSDIDRDEKWLSLAKKGIDFLLENGFDKNGKMFYRVTREGKPLVKRRYYFTETFTIIALAAFGRASGDKKYIEKAYNLFTFLKDKLAHPEKESSKFIEETREMKGFSLPMILLATVQELRLADKDRREEYNLFINDQIEEIKLFLDFEKKCVLETIGSNGEFLNHNEGRLLNPGHAIEASWFLLRESRERGGDDQIKELGLTILDWMWKWGWDSKYGGILYFRDALNHPSSEYWHDMKFWWPQNEAIIATLMAYEQSGNKKYLKWYKMIQKWTYKHFPDRKQGEWFGYLHRDGSVSSTVKGNMFKGPFHIPRMQFYCMDILKRMML
ncbi:MAG: AGE family epimerase/isomerase [Spirochaetaceae bacterium]|jgi:N-acylglucosamine 2-epimerase|nr:AGE family epimerase/isomerase [Spirochaetaceae bacterium]